MEADCISESGRRKPKTKTNQQMNLTGPIKAQPMSAQGEDEQTKNAWENSSGKSAEMNSERPLNEKNLPYGLTVKKLDLIDDLEDLSKNDDE